MIELKRKNQNKKNKLVGRGGSRGKTSGRGTKGQRARAGHKIRPAIRDLIKKYPKLRGRGKNSFKSFRINPTIVNVGTLSAFYQKGENITPSTLLQKKVIRRTQGVVPAVKILAKGEIDFAVNIFDCQVTQAAKSKIEKAGGVIK